MSQVHAVYADGRWNGRTLRDWLPDRIRAASPWLQPWVKARSARQGRSA